MADGFGGEEGIEDAFEGSAIHAAATVADGDTDVGAYVQIGSSEAVVEGDVAAGESNGDGSWFVADGV